jgi:anti-anti-sigma factor
MFDIRVKGGVYYLRGRLDASQAERAERMLDKMQASAVADVSELDYISSAGISALVRTQQRLQDAGHRLTLVNLQPRIRSVFHYAHLEQVFGIE